jgi:hypothetical protein
MNYTVLVEGVGNMPDGIMTDENGYSSSLYSVGSGLAIDPNYFLTVTHVLDLYGALQYLNGTQTIAVGSAGTSTVQPQDISVIGPPTNALGDGYVDHLALADTTTIAAAGGVMGLAVFANDDAAASFLGETNNREISVEGFPNYTETANIFTVENYKGGIITITDEFDPGYSGAGAIITIKDENGQSSLGNYSIGNVSGASQTGMSPEGIIIGYTASDFYQIMNTVETYGSQDFKNLPPNLIVGSLSGGNALRGTKRRATIITAGGGNTILAGPSGDVINAGAGVGNVAFTATPGGGTDAGTAFVVTPGNETIVGGNANDKLVILSDRLWNAQTGVPTAETISYSSPTIQLTGGIEFGSGNNFVADFSPSFAGGGAGTGIAYYAVYSESGNNNLTINIYAENRTSGVVTDDTNWGYPVLWSSSITIENFQNGDFGISFVNDASLIPASDPTGAIYLSNFQQASQQFLTQPTATTMIDDDPSNQWNGAFFNPAAAAPSASTLNSDLKAVESIYQTATPPAIHKTDNSDGSSEVTVADIGDEPYTGTEASYNSAGTLTSKLLLNADGTTYLSGTPTANANGSVTIDYVNGSDVVSGEETDNIDGTSEVTLYGSTGQTYSSIASTFDAAADLTSKTVSNVDGTSEVFTYDATGEPYASTDSLFNASGDLTSETFVNADVSTYQTETVTTDADGSTTTTFVNGAGVVTNTNTTAPDGAVEKISYGVVNEPYAAVESEYNSVGTLTSKLLLNGDGTAYLSGTPTTNSDGSVTIDYVNGSNVLSGEETDNTDGTSEVTLYGAAGQTYSSIESTFDAAEELTSKKVSNVDGTSQVLAYDITGEPYTSTETLFNTSGNLTSETFLNSDGSTYETETVTANADGSTTTTFDNGAGTTIAQEVTSTDGTSQQTVFGIPDEPYTSTDSLFNATGDLTSETFFNADGSTYQTETVTTNADGSITSTFVTGGGATVAQDIDSTDGTFEQIVLGVTGEPYDSTDSFFNASGTLTSETFLNADGSTYQTEGVTTNIDGSTTSTFVNGAGAEVFQEVDNADGTVDQTTYGVTGKPYVSYENVFDANGDLTAQTLINSGGSAYQSETVATNESGTTTTQYFNGNGTLTSQAVDGPNGHDDTFYGIVGQSYASYENEYDVNWTLVSQMLFNADGSVYGTGAVEASVNSATATGAIAKLVSTTGSSTPDTATGTIDFVDADTTDVNSVSITGVTGGAVGRRVGPVSQFRRRHRTIQRRAGLNCLDVFRAG